MLVTRNSGAIERPKLARSKIHATPGREATQQQYEEQRRKTKDNEQEVIIHCNTQDTKQAPNRLQHKKKTDRQSIMLVIRRNNSSTFFLVAWLFWHAFCCSHNDTSGFLLVAAKGEELSCSATDGDESLDPSLQEMEYDIGYGKQSFLAYVEPDVTTFYQGQEKPPSHQKVVPKFPGLATKFINNSNKKLQLYWEAHAGAKLVDMGPLDPFGATGSASHPGHRFVFGIPQQPKPEILHRVIITAHPNNTYAYDPYYVPGDPEATEANVQRELTSDEERKQYQKWRDTLRFSDLYLAKTGRSYIANYLRPRPKHWMWRADYFGQEHWVETRETHFVQHPPTDVLGAVTERGADRVLHDTDPRILSEYRHPTSSKLNMTLKVLSCAPRVFEIENFLSPVEVAHILQVAGGVTLGRSSVGDLGSTGHKHEEDDDVAGTRTSLNSWLPRESSPIFDAVYRRAADVMRIDEALLRWRDESEIPEWPTRESVAESLQ